MTDQTVKAMVRVIVLLAILFIVESPIPTGLFFYVTTTILTALAVIITIQTVPREKDTKKEYGTPVTTGEWRG